MTEQRQTTLARVARTLDALRELGFLGVVLALIVVLPFAGATILAVTTDAWEPWCAIDEPRARLSAVLAIGLFVSVGAVGCGLSFLPTYATSVAAGYLYGTWVGTAIALVAVVLAAGIGRVVMAWVAGDRLMSFIESRPDLLVLHSVLLGERASGVTTIVTLLRLAPVTPFAGTNLLMAAAKVRARPFLVGTLLGLGPRIALFALAGAGLAELAFERETDVTSLVVGGGSLAVSVVGLWVVAKRRLRATLSYRSTSQPRS